MTVQMLRIRSALARAVQIHEKGQLAVGVGGGNEIIHIPLTLGKMQFYVHAHVLSSLL
jgi:hypothetical protein